MSEWKPIETAPRDGTAILVRWADECQRYLTKWPGMLDRYSVAVFAEHDRQSWWTPTDAVSKHVLPATHWMPLPEPPKA